MQNMLSAIAIIAALCAAIDGHAALEKGLGYPEIRAVAGAKEVTIGQPVTYTVTIAGKNIADMRVTLPDKKEHFPKDLPGYQAPPPGESKKDKKEDDPADLIPVFMVSDVKRDDRSDKEMRYQTISMTVAFYRTGTYRLPEVDLRGADDVKIGYKVPEVTVKSVNEKGELQEIEPPLDLGGNYYRLIALVAAIIAVAIAAFFTGRYIVQRRSRKAPAAAVPPIERFMDDIHTLRTRRYIESGDLEAFCVELSGVFRMFLSGQFHADAMEMTAGEIVHYLENLPGHTSIRKYRDDIDRVLNLWDLMKFAEFVPSKEILEGNMESTIALAKKLAMEYRVSGTGQDHVSA